MASITIKVQSLLKAALYDSYTVDNSTILSAFKTTIQTNKGFDPTWYQFSFNNVLLSDETQTLAHYGITTGSSLGTANQIGNLSTLQKRQVAKLNLAELTRAYDARPYVYDINQLPTKYSGNTIVDNNNTDGLLLGRPWVNIIENSTLAVDLSASNQESYPLTGGSTWNDISGNNNNFTLYNSPTYTATQPGYFTLTQSSQQYAGGPAIGNLPQWTVEAWFRTSASLSASGATGLTQVVGTTYQDGSNFYNQINFTITNYNGTTATNNIYVGFFNGAWHLTNPSTPLTPTIGTWYHVVGTYDGTYLKQYNNGVYASVVTVGSASSANGGPVRVGRRWDGDNVTSGYFFPGDVNTVRIYSGALTATQILQNYNAQKSDFGY
jgi:hypothetical protein